MSRYHLAAAAASDLAAIWDYIAEDSIDAADRWVAKLFDALDRLALNPGMGHSREDLTDLPLLF